MTDTPSPLAASAQIEWQVSPQPVDYPQAHAAMEERVAGIADGSLRELVWLLEHPPLYTADTSAKPDDLIAGDRFPVFQTGRGGQYTYHGPGQRVAYVMLDLQRRALSGRGPDIRAPDIRAPDIRAFVCQLERWIIATLAEFGIAGETRQGRVGVWVSQKTTDGSRDAKIAALGIRVRRWVTFHGISLNVAPDLEHFSGIVPCGISDHGVTSLADLGVTASMNEVDRALRHCFEREFGPTSHALVEHIQQNVAATPWACPQ